MEAEDDDGDDAEVPLGQIFALAPQQIECLLLLAAVLMTLRQ